ncbi:MAG: hypothetical protein CME70_11445 [Halobacteriovorax sp.]|nr:hypothetical protein [Halobacteriovorax sp.]|tara:strand:- start:65803 stop:67314 length:1512 start_codon:yes stop_codon:yes gene_type:complete
MKYFLLVILVLLTQGFALGDDVIKLQSEIDSEMGKKVLAVEKAHELTKKFREVANPFHESLIQDLKEEKPLTGAQLTSMHGLVSSFISLAYRIEREYEQREDGFVKLFYGVTLLELIRNTYIKAFRNKKLRVLLNDKDSSFGIEKKELKKYLLNVLSRKFLSEVESLYISYKSEAGEKLEKAWNGHSRVIEKIRNNEFLKFRKFILDSTASDWGREFSKFLLHHVSGAFGNSAGSIKWRRGYLENNFKVIRDIKLKIQPLDVITEKAGFALTDTFIPGHFGHNAIWLGYESELIEMGIWNTLPSSVQKGIRQGKNILETDRSGTHLKSLEDFMNVDEFAILRFKEGIIKEEQIEKIYKVAVSQLGKKYDFNFDVETTDRLVCSELLYQSFGKINWPTEKYLGRTTISPDNVGSLILYNNSPLEMIYFVAGSESGLYEKDIFDFANDIGFKTTSEGFLKPRKVCTVRTIKRPGGFRQRGTSRKRETINIKDCETVFDELNYETR